MRSPASAMRRYFSPPLDEVSGWAKEGVVCGRIQACDTNTTNDLLRSGRSRYRTNALLKRARVLLWGWGAGDYYGAVRIKGTHILVWLTYCSPP